MCENLTLPSCASVYADVKSSPLIGHMGLLLEIIQKESDIGALIGQTNKQQSLEWFDEMLVTCTRTADLHFSFLFFVCFSASWFLDL